MKLVKGSYTILFFKLVGAGLMLLVNVLISNIYGAKYLGVFNLLLTIIQISSMISRAGLDIYFLKIIPSLETPRQVAGFLKKSFIRISISSVLIGVLLLILSPFIDDYFFKEYDAATYIIWIAFLLLPYTFFTIIPEVLRAYENILIFSFIRNLLFQLSVLSSLLFIMFSNYGNIIDSLNYGVLISFMVSLIILYFFLRHKKLSFLRIEKYSAPILRNSYHMFLTSSILLFMGNLDKFMIGYFLDEENVGFYSACIRLSIMVTFVLSSVTSFITPKISKAYSNKDYSLLKLQYKNATRLIILSSLPFIIILALFPSFFLGLFGEEFKNLTFILYLVITMNVANIFFGPLIYILNMMDLQIFVRNVLFIAFTINVLFNLILIPYYGISGAAIATLISTLFWKSLLYLKLQTKLKNLNESI
jgi:O-antigen/teichoic acid export membrane protein